MLTDLKYVIRDKLLSVTGKPVKGHGEFSKKIKRRHDVFWRCADAETIRNTMMKSEDCFDKWRDVEHWQRKLSNKHNAREFAKMHGCKVPLLYWQGRDIDAFDFNQLPAHYVVKPVIGHSCNFVYLMANGVNLMDKRPYTEAEIKEAVCSAVMQNPYQEFLIEEFVDNEDGEHPIPVDYKFYTFNGEIACIQVIDRLGPSTGLTTCYDGHWNRIDNIVTCYADAPSQRKPACFDEMVDQVKVLSKAYELFVRVDYYATTRGAVFGEFTPTPGLGNYFKPEADELLAEYWDRYCSGLV